LGKHYTAGNVHSYCIFFNLAMPVPIMIKTYASQSSAVFLNRCCIVDKPTVLVIDQDLGTRQTILDSLKDEQLSLFYSEEIDSAKKLLHQRKFDLILPNLDLGSQRIADLLLSARQLNPEVVMIPLAPQPETSQPTELEGGEFSNCIIGPFDPNMLRNLVASSTEKIRLRRENAYLKNLVSLYQASQTVETTLDSKRLLGMILEAAIKEFEANLATILLWEESENCFKLAETKMKDQQNQTVHQTHPVSPQVVYLRPQILSSAEEIEKAFPISQGRKVRSLVTYPLLAKGKVLGILYLARQEGALPFTSEQLQSLCILAGKAAAAMENLRLYQQLEQAYISTIQALANAVEARDVYTKGHTDRVWYLAETLARMLGWNEELLHQVKMGSILHDIGKIGVPDRILNKAGRLSPEEFEIMRKHPQMGAKILEGISFLQPALPYVLYHHERYDGRGYPFGIGGQDIPIEGRMMAVVDTFDAITSDRPYRKNLGYQKAIQELREHSGTQFDPRIAAALIQAWENNSLDEERLEVRTTSGGKVESPDILTAV
jgi:HD-GYP domain-containing protein (c-di-GMP phosphodiesterase class II)